MASRQVLFFVVALVTFRDQFIEGRSLGNSKLKDHSIKKRSSYYQWQDTCPPPDFLSMTDVKCKDTCHSDDDCLGNLLCCDNGCKMCMDPVLPPPVLDWLGSPSSYHRGFAAGGVPESNYIEIDLKEPHFEQVECTYAGKSFARGETFLKGCHKCQCNIGGISCQVGPCNIDKNLNEEEHSGEASGEEVLHLNRVDALELSGDADNRPIEYPKEPGTAEFEPLTFHGEKEEGRAEVHIIPRFRDQERPSGNGEKIEHSGREETGVVRERRVGKLREDLQHSGEEENKEISVRQQRKPGHAGREEIEEVSEGQDPKSREDVQRGGEEENIEYGLRQQRMSGEDTGYGGHKDMKGRMLPRRIIRKQPQKDEDLYKDVFII